MTTLFTRTALAGLALLLAGPAAANDYAALIKAKKYAEAERVASVRLAKEPANAEAMVGKVDAIMAAGLQARIGEAVKQAEQCVKVSPGTAGCHLALGKALGWKAMAGGVMSALGYAGDMRDAFKKAVELEPRNLDARFSLLQFYMMAPGIMGGGTGKAETLAAQTAALNPEAGKVMAGMLDMAADRLPKAEAAAMAMQAGADDELNERQVGLLAGIANKYIVRKKYPDAERVLRVALKRFPDNDTPHFMMARVQQEQGRHREAVASLEQLLANNARGTVHYRLGQSLQALGEKARALSAFQKALALKSGLSGKQVADAEAQVAALKG